MGLRLFGSGQRLGSVTGPAPGDPVPTHFEVIRTQTCGAFVVAEIRWPDARNYDGRKIAIYKCSIRELVAAHYLDPHFSEKRGPLVPVARFEPTEQGWQMALVAATQVSRAGTFLEKLRREATSPVPKTLDEFRGSVVVPPRRSRRSSRRAGVE